MLTLSLRRVPVLCLLITLVVAPARAIGQPSIPTPEQFFGFPMGADKKLAGWNEIVRYFRSVDEGSPRVLVQELGKTTLGNPYILAIVSSPDTIANLSAYQTMQRKLADPRKTSQAEADRIAREGKVVVLVGANVHSTEIGTSQMANDLLYRMAVETTPWMEHVLSRVILLLVPSQNPDGQQMVVDWYNRNLGTPYEDSPLPELYHKYVGHDNNRDSYMLTQIETQLLAHLTYKEWLPEVYLDKHQMGSNRARIFVPPFKNPPNPNVDPLIWTQVNMLGQAMAAKLQEAGKTGVLWGEQYSGFWQGANSTNPWWHNMVALLTEVASARLASTIDQEHADPDRAGPRREIGRPGFPYGERDPQLPLPAPTDVQYRMNYPEPWLGGHWSLTDVVEYEMLSTLGLLEAAANNSIMLKRNFYLMNRRTIERFRDGSPYAFLVPPGQRDPIAATKLLRLLQAEAAEVHRAEAAFQADGQSYPAGTHVVLLAQPFGRWVKDLLEPQRYPDIRWPNANAPIDRPYDVTAWTLGMLMGVETVKVENPFTAALRLVERDVPAPPGRVTGSGATYVLNHEVNSSITAMNRLLREGAEVGWARGPIRAGGRQYSPGAIVVRHVRPDTMARIARELRLEVEAVSAVTEPLLPIHAPRLAVYEPWGGNMDAGWTRWLLEQHGFEYTHARDADLRQPYLFDRFDAIVFAEMSPGLILRGNQAPNVRPEYRGGIGEEGLQNLNDFLAAGGTIITLGNATQFAVESLGVPAENVLQGVDQDSFYCPGSILRIALNTRHPIAFGMPEQADAMFINNGAYQAAGPAGASSLVTVARYPGESLLRSGWIIGEARIRGTAAVLEAAIGKGRVIMHTFRVQSRAQTWGTFKLLFNSIFYGPAVAGQPLVVPTEFAGGASRAAEPAAAAPASRGGRPGLGRSGARPGSADSARR